MRNSIIDGKKRSLGFSGLLILGLTVLLSGCFVPITYDVSVPQEIPPGSVGKIRKDIIELELSGLNLSAQVQAYDWDGQYLYKPLGVWLELEPLAGSLTIDTRSVSLRSDDSDALQPIAFLGPSNSWWSPRAFAAGCGPRRYHSGIAITNIAVSQKEVFAANAEAGIFRPSASEITIEEKKCFMFWFDTDTLPDHIFVLTIDGISQDGSPVSVPEIRFEKGSIFTLRGIP
jgi:hypothetical protein